MEIRILGDFEFARQIISGVARMFSLGEGLGVASGILLVLYLIWTFIKHALDPEKSQHPAKEFVFGIILWMALGASGTSAKFDVTLTSVSDPSRFEAINDVPALAALPAWLATNFFQIARQKMEDTFSPASYTLTDRHLDPLSALLQVYDNLPDIGLLNVNPNTDLNRSVRAYMQNCYLADHNLDGAPPESPRAELDKTDIAEALLVWQRVKVTYNFLTTPSYMNSASFGQNMSCEGAWSAINTHLDSAEVRTRITQYYNNKGVSQEAITHAGSMLAGAYSGGIDSYKLQLGLLSSYMIRDGIAGTAMENERDKMIFEAWRKRVVEKGGEATIFKKLMVPMITAIEMFSFFIAPLMMVMAIMGGLGFSYIGKYLMLVLFINLWGFVKVFVDLYTAISVERAFEASAIAPFSFGQYANTFMEIEGFLSTAAALTTAIPMFATFLLYGGVHSVMGVMRAMSGGGGVDSSNMAPTTASSMNGGVRTMGDQTSTYTVGTGSVAQAQSVSENQLYGSTSVSDIAGMGQQATASLANSAVSSSANAVVQSLNDYFAQQNLSGVTNSDSLIKNWSSMSTEQRIEGLAQAMESAGVMSAAEARQAMMQIAAGADISLDGKAGAYGMSAALGVDARAAINASGSQTSQETLSKAEKFLENFQQNYSQTEQGGDTAQNGRLFNDSINFSNGTQGGTVTSRLNDFKAATSEQASFTDGASQINSIAGSQKINNAAVGGYLKSNGDDAMRIYENMKKEHGDALRASGMYYENSADFFSNVGNGDYFKAFMNMNKELANFDSKTQSVSEQAADMRASGALMLNLSQLPVESYISDGFKTAAASYNSQADALEKVDAVNKSIGSVDNTKLTAPDLNTERAKQEAAEREAMAGREDIQKVREEGIASMPSVAPRAPQDTVTGRAEAALQEQKELHGDGKLFKAGQELAAGMVKGVDNLIDFFKGPSQLWGQDGKADGERFQAALTGSDGGFYSLALGKGFEGLASKDLPMMRNNDFVTGSDGSPIKAKSDAYAMNDTIMALKSAYGQDFYKQIPDDENGKRFKEGIDNFMQLKSQLPVEEQQKMDAISAARLSGDLPSAAAERLIANNLKPEGSQISQHDGNYFLFRNNDELKDNMPLLKMAGYAAQGENGWERKLPAPRAGTGAMNHAYNMIKQDEMARLSGNGAFIDGSGGFVTNVNRDYKDERVVKATEQLLNEAIKIDTTARLPENYNESEHASHFIRASNATASDGGHGVAQPFILGIANSGGLNSFADRLARSGFERNAQNVRDFGNALVSNANENGLIVTPEQRTQARERADELVIGNQAGNSQTTETAPKQVNSGEPNSTNAPVLQNADGNNGLGLPYKPQQAMDLEAAGVRYFAMPLEEQRYLGGPAVQDPVQPNSNAAPQPVTPAAATAAQPATATTAEPGTATQATAMQTAEPAPTPVTGIDTMGAAPAPQQVATTAPATLDPVQPNANATQQPVTAAAAAQPATAQTTEPGTATQATAMQTAEPAPTPVTGTDTMGAAPAPQQVANAAPATLDPVQPNSNATQQPVTTASEVTAAQSTTAETTETATGTQAGVTQTTDSPTATAAEPVSNVAPAKLEPVQSNGNVDEQARMAATDQSTTTQPIESVTATQATAEQPVDAAPVTSVLSEQSEIKGSVAAGATGEATTVTGQNAISSTNDVIASNTPAVKKDSNERVANVESSQQVTALAGNSQSAIYTEQTVSTQDSVAMRPDAGSSVDSVAAGAQGEVIQSGSVSAAPETMVNDNATSATTSASDSDFIPVSSASSSSVAVEAAPVVAESGGNPVNLPDQDSTMFTDMNGNVLANGSAITIDNVDYVVSGTHNDGENTYQVLAMADDRDQTFTFQYGRVTPFSKD